MQTRDRRPLIIGGGVILIVILAIVAFVPLGGSPSATPPPGATPAASSLVIGGSPLLGKAAPAFALKDLEGNTVSLADYAGKPVIVNWWASWCVPCREEFPIMVAGLKQHEAEGLEVLGIVYKDNAQNAQAFATDHDAHWPLLEDPDAKTWSAYYGIGVPMTAFIDGNGIVQAMSYGPLSQDGFDSYVKQILPAS